MSEEATKDIKGVLLKELLELDVAAYDQLRRLQKYGHHLQDNESGNLGAIQLSFEACGLILAACINICEAQKLLRLNPDNSPSCGLEVRR